MIPVRKYGKLPYRVVLAHGGPGAAGEMQPVAHHLADQYGVLEPFQTATSITGQCEELRDGLERTPALLVGNLPRPG